MDPKLKALIDAPLANPLAINLPEGRISATRDTPFVNPKDKAAIRKRKEREEADRLNQLYDYYAGKDVPAERVAQHLAVYRQVQVGTDDQQKPIYERQLDVAKVREQLEARRKRLREG